MTKKLTPKFFARISWIFLLLLSLAVLIPVFSQKPFYTRGEPREALVAQSIILDGNWILPWGYGGAVPSKPPMLHWLVAGAAQFTGGVSEVSARLPSAVASIIFALLFFQFTRRRTSDSRAFVATALLVTSIEWYRSATVCRVDMLLSVFSALALMEFYRWYERGYRGFPIMGLGALVAAALTKGPVGIALPLAVSSLFALLQGSTLLQAARRHIWIGLLAVVGAAVWYLLATGERGGDFWAKVYTENIDRLTGAMEDEPHNHPAAYLWASVFLGFLPWSIPLVRSLVPHWRRVITFARNPISCLKGFPPLTQYAVLVVIVYLVFFSIPSSKRSVYLLPMYPFLALLLAPALEYCLVVHATFMRRYAKVLGTLLLVASIASIGLLGYPEELKLGSRFAALQLIYADVYSLFSLQILGVLGLLLFWWAGRQQGLRLFGGFAALWILAIAWGDGQLAGRYARELAPLRYAEEFRRLELSNDLFSYGNEFYALSFYLKRRISRIAEGQPNQEALLFVFEHNLDEFKEKYPRYKVQEVQRSLTAVQSAGRILLTLRITPNDEKEKG
jgi:4-amino-4-deoxy-L-arabinose transferase-like glycosyltransferase